MINFFQSALRKHLNHQIFGREIFEIQWNHATYRGIIKKKSVFGIPFKRYQIQGITLENTNQFSELAQSLKKQIKIDRTTLCIQVGCITTLTQFPSHQASDLEFSSDVAIQRKNIQQEIKKLWWEKGVRENMPLSTILIDLQQQIRYNSQTVAKIKKAQKVWLQFTLAEDTEWMKFYQIWKTTSEEKGFHIMSQSTYEHFISYLITQHQGFLALVKTPEGDIVSWSICVIVEKNIVYLYGATARKYGNIGGHQFLFSELIKWGKSEHHDMLDLFGGAPTGFPEHSLTSVSSFKEGFGGTKIEYVWNYDLVTNPLLYRLFGLLKK